MKIRLLHSLRARLLSLLTVGVLMAAIVQGFSVYQTALREANEIFDYHMQQMTFALLAGRSFNGGDESADNGDSPESLEFVIRVWGVDGSLVYGSSAQTMLPQGAVLGFSTAHSNGSTYRIFSTQTPARVIQVAQDMAIRRQMAGNLAWRAAVPILLLMPLLMLLVWWVVSHSLAPVANVQRQLARRHADELSPVDDTDLPAEVQPLVQELNLLFGRVHGAFETQKNFVADAAHELRSPLAALKLQATALQRAGSDEAKAIAITRLAAGIDRASHLIDQLLALARQESNSANVQPKDSVSMIELGRLAVADAAAQAQSLGIDLGVRGDVDQVIEGDTEVLRVLIRNLVQNAIKYTPAGGTVDVSVEAVGPGAALCVEDSGPGIPPEDRDRVLDRFYRVAGNQAPGSGLGLAIVKSIADRHGAKVVLDQSERLGGLRVRVVF